MPFVPRNFPEAELIEPGRCVWVCRSPDRVQFGPEILNYSLAVVCSESMLPRKFTRTKPATGATSRKDSFPVWLIGKSEFLLVPRAQIYELEEVHREQYERAAPGSDLVSYFTIALESNGDFKFWEKAIWEHKKKVDRREASLVAETRQTRRQKRLRQSGNLLSRREGGLADPDDTDDSSHLEDSDYEGPIRKKPRCTPVKAGSLVEKPAPRRLLTSSLPLGTSLPSRAPTRSAATASAPGAASSQASLIKPEPTDDESAIPAEDLVDIYVGPTNSRFRCPREKLTQSAVLSDRITTTRESSRPSFIMDPTFADINPSDFTAVVQFLVADEYAPILVQSSDGKHHLLDDDDDDDNNNNKSPPPTFLIRSARLFNLGKRFQLPAFADLVVRKILHGHREGGYEPQAFLSFASTVLRYRGGPDFRHGDAVRGVLEAWIVDFLAENMHVFLSGGVADSVAFWNLMAADKGVELAVMEKRVELCRSFPGGRIKIEEED